MQKTTYRGAVRIRHWLVLSIVIVSVSNCSFAQQTSQPDSIITSLPAYHPKPVTGKSFILPGALITTGALGISGKFIISNPEIKEERDEHFSLFHTSVDNYLQYAPIAAGYGMLINNKEHNFWNYTEKVVLTEVVVSVTVQFTKYTTNVKRPNGALHAFPSGHTAQAFAGATIFSDEFAQHKPWLAATAYTSAAAVGVLRVLNNRHWASDVIAGAGFGILSAKFSEWTVSTYNRSRHPKHTYTYQF